MLPRKISSILNEKIPENLIKSLNGKDYISGSTVIGYLNAAFDYDWDFIITEQWVEKSLDKVFIPKNGGEKIITPQPPVAHVKGILMVRYLNDKGEMQEIKKSALGSKIFIGGASEQESVFKAASTDALKKAATLLGLGSQLYRTEAEKAFFKNFELRKWTDNEKLSCKNQLDFITRFKKTFDDQGQDGNGVIGQYVKAFTTTTDSFDAIHPGNIDAFIESIKKVNPNFR